MEFKNFQEQIFFSTVRITKPGKSGVGASIGTGFLYSELLNEADGTSVILLISTRHVFGDPSQPILLNFHMKNNEETGPDLGKTVSLQSNEFKGIFIGHPNPNVDLACINISMISSPKLKIFYKSIYNKMLLNFPEEQLFAGNDVLFIGYPENRFDTVHNLPILRRGCFASMPNIDFNAKQQFIIDAQVFPGSSGSPVFTLIGNKFKLIGVIAETMIKNEKLQVMPTQTAFGVQQFLGLGIVIKVNLINELIDYVLEKIKELIDKQEVEPIIKSNNNHPKNSI